MPKTKDGGWLLDESPTEAAILNQIIKAVLSGDTEKLKEILIPIERR